jgi:hypothetical protein
MPMATPTFGREFHLLSWPARLLFASALPLFIGSAGPRMQSLNAQAQSVSNVLSEKETATGWKLLFDGKTTNGWRGFHQKSFPTQGWRVENGTLHHVAGSAGGDIITASEYEWFELDVDWKIATGGNSGIKYLISEDLIKTGQAGLGFEMQILDDEHHPDAKEGIGGNRTAGSLYDLIAPTNRKLHPVGEWNTARVVVRGSHVEHWLNGAKIVEFDMGSSRMIALIAASKYKVNPGFGKVTKGHILLQDHGDDVWFRNIKILELGH